MLSHNLSHIQFITYTQFQSQFHDSNVTIYHVNLVNLIQNTNKLYKNIFHNIGSKTPQQFHIIIQKELQYNKHHKINLKLIFSGSLHMFISYL